MQNNSLFLNLPSQYSINELIFINAGSNYYVRLPVNQSAALFAGNNEGKTSSLSALKLFLLPEVNFKASTAKFNFSSGGTPFTDIDSFKYYFPSTESYIICEAANPRYPNGFCWILFKSVDYHYDRIAVPYPYSFIEHLFWNSSSDYNESIGSLHNNISIRTIKDKLLSKQYGGILLTDRKIIGEAIYSRTTSQDDHTRFCLLPMIQKSSVDSIKTVRALLDMAFDLSNASTKSLPIAIGSIIDSKGLSVVRDDGIFLDLENKLNEWKTLQTDQNTLSLIEEKLPLWSQFKKEVNEYNKQKSDTNAIFCQISDYTDQALELFNKQSKSLQDQVEEYRKRYNDKDVELKSLNESITKLSTLIQVTEEKIKEDQYTLSTVQRLKNFYKQKNIHTTEKMINDLKQQENVNNNMIESLQDKDVYKQKITKLILEINKNSEQITKLKSSCKKIQNRNSFLDQFEKHTSSVLLSLNENFTHLTTVVSPNEKQIIAEFTHLFMNLDGQLALCNESFTNIPFKKYSDIDVSLKVIEKIKVLEALNDRLREESASLNQVSKASPETRKQTLSEIIKQNNLIASQLRDLTGESTIQHRLNESKKKLDIDQNKLIQQQKSKSFLQQQVENLKDQWNNANSTYERNEKILSNLKVLISELKSLSLIKRGYFKTPIEISQEIVLTNINQYNSAYVKASIEKIKKNIYSLTEINSTIRNFLNIFIDYHFIEVSPEEKYQINMSNKLFDSYYDSLQKKFETLDAQKEHYYRRLQAHNNTVATAIRIINNTKDLIDTYSNRLNRQLAGYQISNLDNVNINIDYHPQYTAAVSAMNKMSVIQDTTYPKELYDNIQNFQASFYIKALNKIDIAKIIEKVSYSFSRNGTKENIPQSNGTNSMVNAILLAILFKGMIPEDLKLQLPVVFDEVGKLDEGNLNEIYKIVTEQNLILFVATPDPTGVIASVLNLYHDLSCFQALDVAIHGKAKTIYFQGMEERLINLE